MTAKVKKSKTSAAKTSAAKTSAAKTSAAKTSAAKSYVVLGRHVRANGRQILLAGDVPIPKGAHPGPSAGGKYTIVHAYEGPLAKGVTLDTHGRTTVEVKPPTAVQQAQREVDAEVQRGACKHQLQVTKRVPIHYEGVWVCDDCDKEHKNCSRHHCQWCFVDVCVTCFEKRK